MVGVHWFATSLEFGANAFDSATRGANVLIFIVGFSFYGFTPTSARMGGGHRVDSSEKTVPNKEPSEDFIFAAPTELDAFTSCLKAPLVSAFCKIPWSEGLRRIFK